MVSQFHLSFDCDVNGCENVTRFAVPNAGVRAVQCSISQRRRKKKLRRKSTTRKTKTNQQHGEPWLTRGDIDQMIEYRLQRTANRSDDSSMATAADSISLQSIGDLSNNNGRPGASDISSGYEPTHDSACLVRRSSSRSWPRSY